MNSTVVCVNGRFSGFVTAPVLVQKQQISCRVRSQHDLKTFAKGSFETFAASRLNVGNGVKGRLCADVLVIPIM